MSKILDGIYDHYADKILEETDLDKLDKIKKRGNLEIRISYPIALCSFAGACYHPAFAIGMIPGLYLNWRGECEYDIAKMVLDFHKQKDITGDIL
ncbi:MAG: hypothetical protein KAT28_00875 [Candidatus Aenigmarchaeota archaeon]|nr:hypothetical protein [Candidatus Aenigmarchaeota archaeon]